MIPCKNNKYIYINFWKFKRTKIKVNDYCEFPPKLNLEQYTQDYLKKKEKEMLFPDHETETPTVNIFKKIQFSIFINFISNFSKKNT